MIPDWILDLKERVAVLERKVEDLSKPAKRKRFAPPSVSDVYEYMLKKGLDSRKEPQKFIDYYTSNGWKVGKNPMKSWKGAIGGWLARGNENGTIDTTKAKPVSATVAKIRAQRASEND